MTAKQSLSERLRETAGLYHASLEDVSMHMDAIMKAADEIERLERENAHFRELYASEAHAKTVFMENCTADETDGRCGRCGGSGKEPE